MDAADLFSLSGRTALVTGGNRGIGRMIAEGFLAQGARVYIAGRDLAASERTAAELGGDCHALPADLSTPEGIRALAADYRNRERVLDVLVNNAGTNWGESFDTFPDQAWDKVLNLNLKAPFLLTQALAPQLRAAASVDRLAKVICIGSVDGLAVNGWETYSYHASKAGLHHLARRMAATLIKDHIAVNAIAPGAFATKMNRAARDRSQETAQKIPAGRIGRAEDIAAAALYLAGRGGDYVVGQVLVVDGGFTDANPPTQVDES
jgi:NAD(P)-dependent dehydrogenase (short-subunit alcohol dehydrogenase family)